VNLEEEQAAREAGDTRWAQFLLDGVLARMNIEADTSVGTKDEHVILTVRLPGDGFDWRRGEYRELRGAIQHIVNRAVSKGRESERRFIIDIGGKLEERTQQLAQLADHLSGKVLAMGDTVHIHLMDSQDRRLLHLGLVSDKRVHTESMGDKQFRVLSVEPKKPVPDEG
jgi:predicted RNA-binding protein Jag